MENTAIVVGAFVTIITGFFAIAKIMLTQASKDRDADRAERKEMIEVFSRVATSNERIADEAKKRNGHAAEQASHTAQLVVQGNKLTGKILARLEKTAVIAAEDRDILVQPTQTEKK